MLYHIVRATLKRKSEKIKIYSEFVENFFKKIELKVFNGK
jgi:hypothetical protein